MGEERGQGEGWRRGAEQEEGTVGGDGCVCTEPRGCPGLWPQPYHAEAAPLFSPRSLGLRGAPDWQGHHGEGLATHVPEAGKEGEERWSPLPPRAGMPDGKEDPKQLGTCPNRGQEGRRRGPNVAGSEVIQQPVAGGNQTRRCSALPSCFNSCAINNALLKVYLVPRVCIFVLLPGDFAI